MLFHWVPSMGRYPQGRFSKGWWIGLVALFIAACNSSGPGDVSGSKSGERTRAIDAITRANIGLAYLEQGSAGKALKEFKKVTGLFPNEALGYANLGLAHFRLSQPQEAETFVRKALSLDPSKPEIHVLLGEILEWQKRDQDATRSYEKALAISQSNVRAHYKLAQLSEKQKDWPKAAEHLKSVVRERPGNLPVLLRLSRLLLRQGRPKEAIPYLTQVAAIYEGVDEEFLRFLNEAVILAEASQGGKSALQVQIFTNLVRGRPLYRQGIAQVSPRSLGLPVERFSPRLLDLVPELVPRSVPIKFRFATEQVSLPTSPLGASAALFFDADNDGRLDIFVCSSTRSRLYRNEINRFVEVTAPAGLAGDARCTAAVAGDYDNDGALDLYLVRDGPNALYRNEAGWRFADVTAEAGVGDPGRGKGALFVDLDHDGDLDLFVFNDASGKASPSRLFRNRGDGRFEEVTKSSGIELGGVPMRAAAFGDLDDDGDIDLLGAGDGLRLFTNLRQGRFKDVAREAGVAAPGKYEAISVADYNNDGFLDIFVTGWGEYSNRLFRNMGKGSFTEVVPGAIPVPLTKGAGFSDVRFADFDNDGHLDVLLLGGTRSGDKISETPGLRLFRNVGREAFVEASDWLPEEAVSGRSASIADYDNDGDPDILLVSHDGRVSLLRNDGGNANHWLKVKLKGLKVGNSKNNLNGIGAKVEIKAGPHYQMRLVESPVTHFGLGGLARADLLRVIWPNGEPDIIFEPSPDQSIQARQRLKGSCPSLYTWDGERYIFVTDIHWRNLLGMVLPGGSFAPPDPAKDSFKIPGGMLRPKGGFYSLWITEEMWETTFLDKLRLFVVDHPKGTEIFVNEAFTPPPFPPQRVYTIQTKRTPLAALDDRGNDIMPQIRRRDGIYLQNFVRTKYQGYTEEHSIILDLGDLSHAPRIILFLHGWLKPFDTSINLATSQRGDLPFKFPSLQVMGKDGQWQTAIENIGAPSGKEKTVVVDLTGKFPTDDFRVRVTTTMEISWDEIFFSTDDAIPVRVTPLSPIRADFHYRGFSRPFRLHPGGPTWQDFNQVTKEMKWRPMNGLYTRYGDVRPLLLEPDDMYVIMGPGDGMKVEFAANQAPPLKPDSVRDFVIFTEGWIKEGETNGAFAQTIEPLVFHGMSRYPYGPDERYPDDEVHREFLRRYVTRPVNGDMYREQVMRYVPSPKQKRYTSGGR